LPYAHKIILPSESSEKGPLSGCYEIFGVPHLDEANGPRVNPQLFDPVRWRICLSHGGVFEDLVSES